MGNSERSAFSESNLPISAFSFLSGFHEQKHQEVARSQNFTTINPSSEQFPSQNFQFRNMSNSSAGLQAKEGCFQGPSLDGLSSYTLNPRATFLDTNTSANDFAEYVKPQCFAHNILYPGVASGDNQGPGFKQQIALKPYSELNVGSVNSTVACSPCTYSSAMPSQNFTFLGQSLVETVSENRGQNVTTGYDSVAYMVPEKLVSVQCRSNLVDAKITTTTYTCNDVLAADSKITERSTQVVTPYFEANGLSNGKDVAFSHGRTNIIEAKAMPEASFVIGAQAQRHAGECQKATDNVPSAKDFQSENSHKQNGPCNMTISHALGMGTPSGNANNISEVSNGSLSYEANETNKSEKPSPSAMEKIWDGSLQLNTSTTVSAIAFYKSGEKVSDIKWSTHVEIKGKVKLKAFETYIQELPRCRTRSLMVVSLCCQVKSSKSGLAALKAVIKSYKENERVGIAQLCPGTDLYVCPRSDTIITLLAKYGFLKGMSAIVEDQDSLIGCVVWRRNLPENSAPSERKRSTLPGRSRKLSESSSSVTNSAAAILDPVSKEGTPVAEPVDGSPINLLSEKHSGSVDSGTCSSSKGDPLRSTSNYSLDTLGIPSSQVASFVHYHSPVIPDQQTSLPKVDTSRLQPEIKKSEALGMEVIESHDLVGGREQPVLFRSGLTSSGSNIAGPPIHSATEPTPSASSTTHPKLDCVHLPDSRFQQTNIVNTGKSEPSSSVSSKPAPSSVDSKPPALPGPPPLPPEILQMLLHARRNAVNELAGALRVVGTPFTHAPSEMGPEPSRLPLPGPPPLPPEVLKILPINNITSDLRGSSSILGTLQEETPIIHASAPINLDPSRLALPGPPPLPPEVLKILALNRNSNKELIGSTSNAEVPSIPAPQSIGHEPSSRLALPGPPPLPPEILKVLLLNKNSRKDLEGAVSVVSSPVSVHKEEPIKTIEGLEPATLVGRPLFYQQQAQCHKPAGIGPDDDLPEYDFGTACGAETRNPSADLPIKPGNQSHQPLHSSLGVETRKPPANPGSFGGSDGRRWRVEDDDMPEWCPPDQQVSEHVIAAPNRTNATAARIMADQSGSHVALGGKYFAGLLGKRPATRDPAAGSGPSDSMPPRRRRSPRRNKRHRF